MRQQVDMVINLDVDSELSRYDMEDCIRSAIDNIDIERAEVMDIDIYEEGEIYSGEGIRGQLLEALIAVREWHLDLEANGKTYKNTNIQKPIVWAKVRKAIALAEGEAR